MNIRITNGERKITLTNGEKAALVKALDVCKELERQGDGDAGQAAQKAATWIAEVQEEFATDAAQSEPEAAATK